MMAIRLVGMRPKYFLLNSRIYVNFFNIKKKTERNIFDRPNFDSRGKANDSKYVFPFY
jgi:hypothetical protein